MTHHPTCWRWEQAWCHPSSSDSIWLSDCAQAGNPIHLPRDGPVQRARRDTPSPASSTWRVAGDPLTPERLLHRSVFAITRAIANATDDEQVLRLAVEKTAACTGAAACVLVLSQDGGAARVVHSVGVDRARVDGLVVHSGDGELCRALGFAPVGQFVSVPVRGTEEAMGHLAIYREADSRDASLDKELLGAIADQVAAALVRLARERQLRASAEAAEISRERFRNLVEMSSDWLWEVNEHGVYTYCSPVVRELLGYEPHELLGRTPFDLMPPDEATQVAGVFSAIAARRVPFAALENTNLHRDGHLVVLETSGVPLFDTQGNFRGYRGIDRDITERKRAEQALRASEEMLWGIISTAADAIISVDAAQRIVMFNNSAEQIFGWTRGEIVGRPLDTLIPERSRRLHRYHMARFINGPAAASTMEAGHHELVGLRKNGEEFPVDAALSRLQDGLQCVSTIVVRDMTEQKRSEAEKLYVAEVGTVLAETLDAEGTLASVAALALRGIADFCIIDFVDDLGAIRRMKAVGLDPAKQATYDALQRVPFQDGRPLLSWAIIQSRQPRLLTEIAPAGLDSAVECSEHRQLLETLAPTSIMGVPLMARGGLLGALVVSSSHADKRFDGDDLRLLGELGQRAALALENARLYRVARSAVQIRDDVLGVVAHDLRNPLGTVLLQARLLQRLELELGPRARKLGDILDRAARRMNRLIQDLLDTTRMETGSLAIAPERVRAGQVLRDAEESQRAIFSSGALQFRLELAQELPDIWGDRDRLLQVLENLLGNAAKFTPAGGRITLGARPVGRDVVFWVADTGEGIQAAHVPRLFDRFWQARKGERRGAGLGLSIAKGIVQAHGGRIWVDSTPGQGSTFRFTIPIAPPGADGPDAVTT